MTYLSMDDNSDDSFSSALKKSLGSVVSQYSQTPEAFPSIDHAASQLGQSAGAELAASPDGKDTLKQKLSIHSNRLGIDIAPDDITDRMLERSKKQLDDINSGKEDALKRMNDALTRVKENKNISASDAASIALMTLIPTALGAAIGGKLGAAAGGTAGYGAGSQIYQGILEQRKDSRAADTKIAEQAAQEARDYIKEGGQVKRDTNKQMNDVDMELLKQAFPKQNALSYKQVAGTFTLPNGKREVISYFADATGGSAPRLADGVTPMPDWMLKQISGGSVAKGFAPRTVIDPETGFVNRIVGGQSQLVSSTPKGAETIKEIVSPAAQAVQVVPSSQSVQATPSGTSIMAPPQSDNVWQDASTAQVEGLRRLSPEYAALAQAFVGTPVSSEDLNPALKAGETPKVAKARAEQAQLNQTQNLKDAELWQKKFGDAYEKILPKIAEVDQINDQLDRIDEIKKNVYTGPVLSRLANISQTFDTLNSKDRDNLRSQVNNVLSNYVKSLSGLTVSDKERANLEATVPNMNDGNEQFVNKLQEFKRIVDGIRLRHLREAGLVPTNSPVIQTGALPQGYSQTIESGINRIMKDNGISREDAIKALKEAGKL